MDNGGGGPRSKLWNFQNSKITVYSFFDIKRCAVQKAAHKLYQCTCIHLNNFIHVLQSIKLICSLPKALCSDSASFTL
jgi:hypothetical protein